jgi:hypothetical protein
MIADDKTPAAAFAKTVLKNIKLLMLEDLHTSLLDIVEPESCNNISVFFDTVNSNKRPLDPHMNGT